MVDPADGRAGKEWRVPAEACEELLEEMIVQQRGRVFDLGRRIWPAASVEDILNPQDVPTLAADPRFNYEDGLLAGLMAAQMALRARVFRAGDPPGRS